MRLTTLNGWQRLWVLIAIAWGLAVATGIGKEWYAVGDPDRYLESQICRGIPDNLTDQSPRGRLITKRVQNANRTTRLAACYPRTAVVVTRIGSWSFPVVLLYGFGWGLGWARRGFTQTR